jgi:hypothetical protein
MFEHRPERCPFGHALWPGTGHGPPVGPVPHHFSHTWLDRGGAERDLTELNGWTSPQMPTRYGASARRTYDRIMDDST